MPSEYIGLEGPGRLHANYHVDIGVLGSVAIERRCDIGN